MKVQTKIFLITLAILISTLVLNSVLSISSFEKIYSKALISTYETGGKNFKRKIEQSLRYGKPLDKFEGMHSLLSNFMFKNPHTEFTGIINPEKEILYHTDIQKQGRLVKYNIPDFSEENDFTTYPGKNLYITFLKVFSDTELSGYIYIGIPKSIVTNKIQSMAFSNFKTLSAMILFTGAGLIFFLGLLIVKPMRSDIKEISDHMTMIGNKIGNKKQGLDNLKNLPSNALGKTASSYFNLHKLNNEILKLNESLKIFYSEYSRGIDDIEYITNEFLHLKNEIEFFLEESKHLISNHMMKYPDDRIMSEFHKVFLKENSRLSKILNITFLFLSSEEFIKTGSSDEA